MGVVAGNQSAQISLRGSSRNQSVATPLGQAQPYSDCTWYHGKCKCVDQRYADKCRSCMCGEGSTRWCDTACDPAGDDRENSCCKEFKQDGEHCSQNWECAGPGTGPGWRTDGEIWPGLCRAGGHLTSPCHPGIWCTCVIY